MNIRSILRIKNFYQTAEKVDNMQIIRSIIEMQQHMMKLSDEKSIGFVATMGFFHDGHITLMKEASKDNDVVVTSIFVNPLQFGPNEDFEQYPRDEAKDIQLASLAGVDIIFIPDVYDMYPTEMAITMSIVERVNVLCGRSRPGHFDGVITVLTKLFNIIRPDKAYFGLKDAQQVAVVDALITDLNFPIELIGLPTVRESDGLAKSSRNVYLTTQERNEAVWISKALQRGCQLVVDGEKNPDIIIKEVTNVINNYISGTVDYVELLEYPTLLPTAVIKQQVVLAAAVKFSRARLIDNLLFDGSGKLIKHIK